MEKTEEIPGVTLADWKVVCLYLGRGEALIWDRKQLSMSEGEYDRNESLGILEFILLSLNMAWGLKIPHLSSSDS